MAKIPLTLVLVHGDRHLPFFDGSVQAEGTDLKFLEVGRSVPLGHGADRHERMLRRLLADPCREEGNYDRKNGFYPIMYLMSFTDEEPFPPSMLDSRPATVPHAR